MQSALLALFVQYYLVCVFVRVTFESTWGIIASYHYYHILRFKHGLVALVEWQVKHLENGKVLSVAPEGKYNSKTRADL